MKFVVTCTHYANIFSKICEKYFAYLNLRGFFCREPFQTSLWGENHRFTMINNENTIADNALPKVSWKKGRGTTFWTGHPLREPVRVLRAPNLIDNPLILAFIRFSLAPVGMNSSAQHTHFQSLPPLQPLFLFAILNDRSRTWSVEHVRCVEIDSAASRILFSEEVPEA